MATFKIFILLNDLGVNIHGDILKKTCRLNIFLIILLISRALMRWFDCKQRPLRWWINLLNVIVIFTFQQIWIYLILNLLIKRCNILVLYDVAVEQTCIIVFTLRIVLDCRGGSLLYRICTITLLVHLGMKYLFLLLGPVLRVVLDVDWLVTLFLRTIVKLLIFWVFIGL